MTLAFSGPEHIPPHSLELVQGHCLSNCPMAKIRQDCLLRYRITGTLSLFVVKVFICLAMILELNSFQINLLSTSLS
jgi:hypothetical protein